MKKKSKPLGEGGNIIPDLKEEFIAQIMQEIPEEFLPAIQVAFEAAAYGMAKVFLSPANLFQRAMLKQQLTQELEEWINTGDEGWDRWIAQMNGVKVFFENWEKVNPSFLGKKAVLIEGLSMIKFFVTGLGYFKEPNSVSAKAEEVQNLKELLVGKEVFVRMGNIPEYFPGELRFDETKGLFYIDQFKDETFFELSEVLDADLYNSISSSFQ